VLVQKHAWLVIVLNHAEIHSHSHFQVVRSSLVRFTPESHCQSGSKVIWSQSFGHVSCSAETLIFQHRPVSLQKSVIYGAPSFINSRLQLGLHDLRKLSNCDFSDRYCDLRYLFLSDSTEVYCKIRPYLRLGRSYQRAPVSITPAARATSERTKLT